jgi:hypothetical protein
MYPVGPNPKSSGGHAASSRARPRSRTRTRAGPALATDEHARWREVRVEDLQRLRVGERRGEPARDLDGRGRRNRPARVALGERLAVEGVVQHEEDGAALDPTVVHLDEALVAEVAEASRLEHHALDEDLIAVRRVDRLDRDVASEPRVPGAIEGGVREDRERRIEVVSVGEDLTDAAVVRHAMIQPGM